MPPITFPDTGIIPVGLTIPQINLILSSIRKLAWEDANELIVNLINQANQYIGQYIQTQTDSQTDSQNDSPKSSEPAASDAPSDTMPQDIDPQSPAV